MQRALEIARSQRTAAAEHPLESVTIDAPRARAQRVVFPEDPGAAAQSYRMLRTQVLHRIRQHSVRSFAVVSAADGEGKTLTAINLSLALAAEPNQSVLLADLDLRRPCVAAVLDLPVTRGLDSWLEEGGDIAEFCRSIEGIPRLTVLPTIAPVPGSSEALASPRTRDMLAALKSAGRDRLVVIDLPPVLLTDDFLTLRPFIDGVILVACERLTRREDLLRVRELLGPVRLLGTVLNRASESERRAY